MSNVVNKFSDQLRFKNREKKLTRFINTGKAINLDYRSKYVLEQHGKTKHICIVCLTAEARLNSRGVAGTTKHCQTCYDKLPRHQCKCGTEFVQHKNHIIECASCYYSERQKVYQNRTIRGKE